MSERIIAKYIPMTETAYCILNALTVQRHGYGILGYVRDITNDRVKLGPGTIYGTLSKMEKDGLIDVVSEVDRRRTYIISDLGREILTTEVDRLKEMIQISQHGGVA